jgi:O-antigen/teichoic acid export membrane protein
VQPAIVLVGLVGLWIAGQVDVGPVLAVHAASWVVTLVLVALLLREDLHVGRPSRHVARASFAYGLRLHGQSLGSLATARLDVMVMPAILAPAQIGWYVVAVSAASLVVPLFGQVRSVVFAAGARHHRQRAIDITLMALRFSLLGSAAAAVVLGVVAPVILRLVYGDEFVAASTPLRILLPGIVAWCAAGVLTSGLNALGRPGVGSAAQGIGALATVVGLALTLPTLGIEGAAITSSVSYVAVFVVLWLAIRQEPGCSLAAAVSPFRLAADLRQLLASRRAGS